MSTAMRSVASVLARQTVWQRAALSSSQQSACSTVLEIAAQQPQEQEQRQLQQRMSAEASTLPARASDTSMAHSCGMFALQGWLLSPQMQHALAIASHTDDSKLHASATTLRCADDGLDRPGVVPIDEPTTALGQGESDGEPASGPMICGKRGTTYQPSRRKRINSHGLEKRLSTPGGRETLMRRMFKKKRARLTADCFV